MRSFICIVSCLALAGGCGDDGASSDVDITVTVSAAAGGTVAGGGATLDIPGGALGADTDITLRTSDPGSGLPDAGTLKGKVFDFGPDGTTFSTPAMLKLPVSGTPATGQVAVISWLDGSQWVDLSTTVSGGTATAPVAHFTSFVLRFVDAPPNLTCDFTACGGNIVATWTIGAICIANVTVDNCPGATVDVSQVTGGGTATFNADMTFAADLNLGGTVSKTLPASCLPQGTTACSQLDDSVEGISCTGDPATSCTCTEPAKDPGPGSGTYTTSGNTFTTLNTGSTTGTRHDYCVNGDELKVQRTDSNGVVFTYIATK